MKEETDSNGMNRSDNNPDSSSEKKMAERVDALLILDGWGVNPVTKDNAVAMAETPFLDMLEKDYPGTRLLCSGNAVGLPDGVMGNSEVGHMNIGAGRKVFQDLVRINMAIEEGSFFSSPELVEIMSLIEKRETPEPDPKKSGRGSALHIMGLLSDGGVHSHISHLKALLDMADRMNVRNTFIHAIMDGRDTPPKSGIDYLQELSRYIEGKEGCRIATLCGRFYAMDRDTRWDRVEKAYDLYTQGTGDRGSDPIRAIKRAYDSGLTDEFITPHIVTENDATVRDGDAIIFFNFRADRAREITRAFTQKSFDGFKRKSAPVLSGFLCMTQYDESFSLPVMFKPQHLNNILGEIVSNHGLAQLRIAETEKYAHVTYFFNGGNEKVFPLEERVLIPSPRDVKTYDEKPEMSAYKVAATACQKIKEGPFRLIILNFANMDMVGHTGDIDAAIKACSTVDSCAKDVVEAIWSTGGTAIITADHGNAEQMRDENGNPHTAHTLNPVKLILAGEKYRGVSLHQGILGDIAPTILKIIGLEQPAEMTGSPLF